MYTNSFFLRLRFPHIFIIYNIVLWEIFCKLTDIHVVMFSIICTTCLEADLIVFTFN